MKLCQENTELAEKLKSIIDQYELREEVSGALAAGWDGQHTRLSQGKQEALPAAWIAFGCLTEVTRVAPTVLLPPVPAASPPVSAGMERCGSHGSLAAVGRGAEAPKHRDVPAASPVTAPPNPWGPPPASLSSFPLSSH